jgi:hypothetical protein
MYFEGKTKENCKKKSKLGGTNTIYFIYSAFLCHLKNLKPGHELGWQNLKGRHLRLIFISLFQTERKVHGKNPFNSYPEYNC